MKRLNGVAAGILALFVGAGGASAQEGFYYGLALGLADLESESAFGRTEGNDLTFGGVVGYRWVPAAGNSLGIEATLDLTTKNLMEGASYVGDSCIDTSPDWCEVQSIARLRGVYGITLGNGIELVSMAGFAAASGVAEDGPGNYPDTTATGFTLGVGGQKEIGMGTLRIELTYDELGNTDPEDYDKTLRILSLRSVLLF